MPYVHKVALRAPYKDFPLNETVTLSQQEYEEINTLGIPAVCYEHVEVTEEPRPRLTKDARKLGAQPTDQ